MSNDEFDSVNMKYFDEPVEFPLTLFGEKLTAKVIAAGYDDTDNIFEIIFSNGYHDYFYLNDERFNGDSPDSKPYADTIAQDMHIMLFYQAGKLMHNFRYTVKKEVNVWVQESGDDAEPKTYAVHYFGQCQFFINKIDGKWRTILPSVGKNGNEDIALIQRIGTVLDKLT